MSRLTHLDESGAARMVDVSEKDVTVREAAAEATIKMSAEGFAAIVDGAAPKGDVLAAARIAGIMAAKKTSELIPLCHSLPLSKVAVEFNADAATNAIRIWATAKTKAQTGVEMEALMAAGIAALTIYDMVKAVDREAVIESIRLLAKSGGKSGAFVRPERSLRARPARRAEAVAHETPSPAVRGNSNAEREAFRQFMVNHHLRATEWAKRAGVSPAPIYAFLTGRSRAIPPDAAEKLARAANARVEDMFRTPR